MNIVLHNAIGKLQIITCMGQFDLQSVSTTPNGKRASDCCSSKVNQKGMPNSLLGLAYGSKA